MRASNASATSFAANRTFRAFLGVYLFMAFFILGLLGSIYYDNAKNTMLLDHRLAMQLQSETYIPRVKTWLLEGAIPQRFPKDLAYNTAIYDAYKHPMASRLVEKNPNLNTTLRLHNGYVHYVIDLASYEMGDKFLVFETRDDGLWWQESIKMMAIFGVLLFMLFLILGVYLSSLILRPMREALSLLDRFIQDTTHELNTPVSAIITNVEALERHNLDEKSVKKIRRIDIAARTISTIYDDLTYLILNHDVIHKKEHLNVAHTIEERLEYFKHRYEQKSLSVTTDIVDEATLYMDPVKLTRIVDNLISNAIKYNHQHGEIHISFKSSTLTVQNSGRGISDDKIHQIFERYQRADTSVGGFGIGLHIVAMIAKEYHIRIQVDSQPDAMTTITLQWP